MIKLKGNSTYIKSVQAPKKLEIQVTCNMHNGSVFYNPKPFCFPATVIDLNLDPSAFINRTGNVLNDMNDYIYSVLDIFVNGCYDKSNFGAMRTSLLSNYASDVLDAFDGITKDLRNSLDNETFLSFVGASNAYGDNALFSIMIGGINFDFEHGFMSNLFNDKYESFLALFFVGNLYRSVGYNNNSSNRYKYYLSPTAPKVLGFKEFYNILTEIFFFYAFQARRTEVIAGKMFDLTSYSNSRKARGEIYVWDNNLEQYMSYVPRRENKWVIGDLCGSINVPHDMSEGFNDLYEEFKTDGGEKYNPIERRKIAFIEDSKGDSDLITFVTMPPKRYRYYRNDVMLNCYNAYRSYKNSNGTPDAVGITLYTTNKSSEKSIAINKVIYSDTISELTRNNFDLIKLITYDDLLFNSVQYDFGNPEIEFKCRVGYFTKGGGRTLKSEEDLKTAKIPKEKRDQIFEALCDLCYELDIEPQDVLDRLDVDFKRLYKNPTELL